jgi:2-succinyl-5-enolpyruvyl-6-hydroxy-3-cyclohexene-1-carboxylate synthase
MVGVPTGGNLVVASSMPIRDLDAWAPARGNVQIVSNRGASGIDGFVSTALGVALGSGTPTVAVTGDLSLLHDANGFLLRSDGPSASVVFVVIDNDGGGIFHFLPQADHPGSFERVFGTPHGVDLAGLGRLHGLDVVQPSAGQVVEEVAWRAEVGGLHLVHVRTDRHANRVLHADLQDAVAHAVSG